MPSANSKPKPKPRPSTIPSTVSTFTILPLTLPALHSQSPAPHYLYIQPHAPKLPEPHSERRLYITNLPIDATTDSLRSLFADQLGGGRVERVVLEANIPSSASLSKKKDEATGERRGKKRKRGVVGGDGAVVVVEDKETALPQVWDRALCASGSGAVVVFVDKASARGAMGAVKMAVDRRKEVVWRGEEGLGEKRESVLYWPSCG
jgi:ribosomal RNA-processing protein 7